MDYAIAIMAILALAALAAWGFLALFGIPFWIMFLAFTACGALGFLWVPRSGIETFSNSLLTFLA